MAISRSHYALLVNGLNACPPYGNLSSELRCELQGLYTAGASKDSVYSALGLPNPDAAASTNSTAVEEPAASIIDGTHSS